MKKKITVIFLAAVLVLSGCGGSGGNGGDTDPSERDTLIFGIEDDATIMDPTQVGDNITQSLLGNIFEPIVRQDEAGRIVPGLADSWEISEDGLEYTFHLAEGVTFHDGVPVTVEDVIFSIGLYMESAYTSPYMGFIDYCEKIDDSTLNVVLQYPFAPALSTFVMYTGVVREDFYDDDGNMIGREPIGCGPYTFVEWAPGNRIVLKANEDYFRGAPPIENIIYRIIADKTTAAIALEKGEVDMYQNLAHTDLDTIRAVPGLDVLVQSSGWFFFLMLNTEAPPFDDMRVRQAVAKSVDKEGIVHAIMDGNAEVATSFISKGMPGYIEGFDPFPYDPDGAIELLADAGYPDGFDTTIIVPESRRDHAQIIQANLRSIGINAEIEVLEVGAYWDRLEAGEFDISFVRWGYMFMDPDVGIYSLYKSDEILSGNYVRYDNPTVDELLEEARAESDPVRRDALYQELEEIVMTEAAFVPVFWSYSNLGYNTDIHNVQIPMADNYMMYRFSW